MVTFMKHFKNIFFMIFLLTVSSCAHIEPIPTESMNFEQGMQALAVNLADQFERSSIGNVLNKVIINPVTKQRMLKKIG